MSIGPPRPEGPSTLGSPRLHLRRTDSTNDRVRELAIAGAPHGMLVTAAMQTAGRGRHGRRWSAPAGSALLASLLLRSPPRLLPLIAAVAVCDVAGPEARIKWPNDVVIARARTSRTPAAAQDGGQLLGQGGGCSAPRLAKLAGILVEGRPQEGWAVLGIGLNVAVRLEQLPAELRLTAATLGLSREAIEPTLERLLAALGRRLAEPGQELLEAWRARDALRGCEIVWGASRQRPAAPAGARTSRGRAEGIDGSGRLIVALAGGGHTTLEAGEVHLAASA